MDLLRLALTYCLGDRGLRSTAAWATAMGLADNVALLQRLRRCGEWLALSVGEALAAAAPQVSRGRLIRIIDAATTVPKAGAAAKRGNKLRRIHSAFDRPAERFGHFELTDRHGVRRLVGFRCSKARFASPIAPICSPTASPPCSTKGLTC
jgi:hypothetical protein